MNNMKKTLLIALALFATNCIGCPPNITPDPIVIVDTNMCQPACTNLRALGCEEGTPIFTGEPCNAGMGCSDGATCIDYMCKVTCERFCEDTQKNGVWLNPTCVTKITDCSDIETCALGN